MNVVVGTLIDLQGPEIRINIPNEKINLALDELISLSTDLDEEEKGFTIPYQQVISDLEKGQHVYVDDGAFSFIVEETGNKVRLRSLSKGMLGTRKTMNVPGLMTPLPVLIERDYDGLQLARDNNVDFVALSFVRSAQDVEFLREELHKRNISSKIVSKIEAKAAIDHLDEIIEVTDAIMVARGDLGVEVPVEQVPYYQKVMIKKSIEKSKPVITATQMLQSMIKAPYPTRAEISDVANAVYDLSDAVMLSGETATGDYPLEVVNVMAKTALFNENKFYQDRRTFYDYEISDIGAMICNSAYSFSLQCLRKEEHIVGFLVFTQSGKTANLLSRYRPHIPIYAFSESQAVCDTLSINFGVVSFTTDVLKDHFVTKDEIYATIEVIKSKGYVQHGDRLILVYGDARAESGNTDTIKIIEVR
jgi:pyruvate kinase